MLLFHSHMISGGDFSAVTAKVSLLRAEFD